MAANLDKAENTLTEVSTVSYIRGIDANGNSVRISTSNLASILGVTSDAFGSQNPDAPSPFYGGARIKIGNNTGIEFCYDYSTLWVRLIANGEPYQSWKAIQFK